MKAAVLSKNLSHAVDLVKRIRSKDRLLPQLGHVLIATDNGRLAVRATDLTTDVTVWTGAQVFEEGSISVPLHKFNFTVDERVDLEVEGKCLSLIIGSTRQTIIGQAGVDFPPVPKLGDSSQFYRCTGWALAAALRKVLPSALPNDSHSVVLQGVLIETGPNRLQVTACDGFRLTTVNLQTKVPKNSGEGQFIIPGSTASFLIRAFAKEDEDVDISLTPTIARFETNQIQITCRLIAGSYPNYRQTIPANFAISLIALRTDLLTHLKAMQEYVKNGDGIIRMEVLADPWRMRLFAQAKDLGEYEGFIPVAKEVQATEPDPWRVAINNKYLRNALETLDGETANIRILSPSRPIVISEGNCSHTIMPVFVVAWPAPVATEEKQE